jgi:hypothetical protein
MKDGYVVVFNKTEGTPHIKNKIFASLFDASNYADAIDQSRKPKVYPAIDLYPAEDTEFSSDDCDRLAAIIHDIRMLVLFNQETDGLCNKATHHVVLASNALETAIQHYQLAALEQAEALGAR